MPITDSLSKDGKTITFSGSASDTLGNGTSAVDLKGALIVDIVDIGAIADRAFFFARSLTSITIPTSVTNIGDEACFGARSLTSITVDSANNYYSDINGVLFNKLKTTLRQYPAGNTRITYEIPPSVESIGVQAFQGARSLTTVTFTTPSSLKTIGSNAFSDATSLTSITIPPGVESIGVQAFNNASGLTSITFTSPSTLKTIGVNAFRYAKSLTSITIPQVSNLLVLMRSLARAV